jgi:hypothetical protein
VTETLAWGWQDQNPRYANPSDTTAQPMQPKRPQRRTITLDLPPAQIAWLDQQAGALLSRSAFVRQLINAAMEKTTK